MKLFKFLTITLVVSLVTFDCIYSLSVNEGTVSSHEAPANQSAVAKEDVNKAPVTNVKVTSRFLDGVNSYSQSNYPSPVYETQQVYAPAQNYGSSPSYAPVTQTYASTPSYEQPLVQTYQPSYSNYSAPIQTPPSYSTPSYSTPSYSSPSYSTPAIPQTYSSPSYSTPSYPTPSYPTPSYSGSNYSAPVVTPSYSTPSYSTPSYSTPTYSNYSTPSYSTPSYSTPSYSTPSYSTPSYPTPSYNNYSTPSYTTPSYSTPSYSTPSYQAPSYNNYSAPSYTTPTYSAPSYSNYTAPVQSYAPQVSSYQAPVSSYQAPVSSYQAPVSSYQAPVSTYSAPVSTYSAPASTYSAPVSTYSAPVSTYSAPTSGYSPQSYTPQVSTYNTPVQSYTPPISSYTPPVQSYETPIVSNYSTSNYGQVDTYSQPQTYNQPSYSAPVQSYNQPSYSPPVQTYNQPSYSAPAQPSYSPPVQTYSQPSYSAPAQTYSQPSYSAPAQTYNQPSYSPPVQTYNQPSYSAPVQSYNQPSYSAPVQPSYQGTLAKRHLNTEDSPDSGEKMSDEYGDVDYPASEKMSTSESAVSPILLPAPQAVIPPPPPPYVAAQPLSQLYNQKPQYIDTQPEFTQSWTDFPQPPGYLPSAFKVQPPYVPSVGIGYGYVQPYNGPINPASIYTPVQPPYYYKLPPPAPYYLLKQAGYGKRSLTPREAAPYQLLVDHLAAATDAKDTLANVSTIECPPKPSDYTCPKVLNISKEELKKAICEYETAITGVISLVPETDKADTNCGALKVIKQDSKIEDETAEMQKKLAIVFGKQCQLKQALTGKSNNDQVFLLFRTSVPTTTKYILADGSNIDLVSSQVVTPEEISALMKQCPKKSQ